MTYELGVDVSKWQVPEKVDWVKFAAQGIKFVYARCSYGILEDTTFYRHAVRAMAKGIQVGGYQYLLPQVSAKLQAQKAKVFAQDFALPFVLDVEQRGLNSAVIDNWIGEFMTYQIPLMIYTSKFAWKDCYGLQPHPHGQHKLWVANYTDASSPAIPSGWNHWDYWQYSSRGKLEGFAYNIDMNRRQQV